MRPISITLELDSASLLACLALLERRTELQIVEDAIHEYARKRGIDLRSMVRGPERTLPDEEWSREFEAVLERIRAGLPKDLSPEGIEADITAASEEVRHRLPKGSWHSSRFR